MKNIKKIFICVLLSSSSFLMSETGALRITNRSTTNVRVYVGCRNTQETDNFIAALGVKGHKSSLKNARESNSTIITPGNIYSLPYGHAPRGIFVDFLDANGAISSTISFPFGETNSEIYILGGTDSVLGTIAQSVAYWNLDAVKAKFPNGLIGDASGNLTADQLALLTPASTDVKAWDYNNRDHTGLMVCMYSKDFSPKITG